MIQRKLLMRTTSLFISPRARSDCLPSGSQSKSDISPEVNLVSCFGFPPVKGSSQMLVTPSRVTRDSRPLPSGDQRKHAFSKVQPDTSSILAGELPSTGITASLLTGSGL